MGKNTPLTLVVAAVIAISIAVVNIAYAASNTVTIVTTEGTLIYTPGQPIWNPYAPNNFIGVVGTYMSLAFYNPLTAKFYPVLAENWTVEVLPNGSGILTIYLRHNLYWFNGSAVMPFTAWDVYAEFYIGVKVFSWYYPFMQPQYADEDIRVLNNYTIQFLFQEWSPQQIYYVLTTWIDTPYAVWKPIVDKLKTMSVSQAAAYGNNVTKFAPPYWGLSPYYVQLSTLSATYQTLLLEPMYFNGVPLLASWDKIFPFNDWSIYPKYVIWAVGGNTQAMTALLARKVNLAFIGLSLQQEATINASGLGEYNGPNYATNGYTLNPNIYPFNIPQVRQGILLHY